MSYLTEKLQSLADQCAKDNGFYAASYVGPKNDVLIFAPMMQDSISLHDGPTGMIAIAFNKPEYITTNDPRLMDYVYFFMQNGSYARRGVRAYETLLRRLDAGKLPKKDVEYATYIKEHGPKPVEQGKIVEPLIDPMEFFMYFDIANRLGKQLQFCEREDGIHYLKILD